MSKVTYTPAQKAARIASAREILAKGGTVYQAAKELNMAQSCLAKWLNPPPPKEGAKNGRPRKLVLTDDERRVFIRGMLDHNSIPVAARKLWEHAETSEATRRVIGQVMSKAANEGKAPVWPVEILEAAKVPEVIEAWHRGPKHARNFEPKAQRNGNIVLEDGTVIQWQPGWIYESDDMSINEPYRFYDAALMHETIGRQGLFSRDAASAFNLQLDLCGRPFHAYRAEDIAEHMLNVVDAHGLPLMWRLEMGSWASNFVKGIEIEGRKDRWGALADLFYVRHKFESTGKANIERSFHEQQKLSAHASTHIGRDRGEFEIATKHALKAVRGNAEALRYFWTMPQAADALKAILIEENLRVRSFRKLGDIRSHPEKLFAERVWKRPLEDSKRWYFCPVKREATIRNGTIKVKVANYPHPFRFLCWETPGFPILREKHPVLIAFHPAHPERGCHVFNAATGPEAKGFAWGELMGVVEHFRDTPEEDLSGNGDFGQVSKAKANLRAEYRSIVPAGTGPGTMKSLARDGLGNALAVQTGGSVPDAVAAPPPRPRREIQPATSSRAMPANAAEEIERLKASLLTD